MKLNNMQRDEEKFGKLLIRHKKLIVDAIRKKDEAMLPVMKTGKELALVFAGCRCEKCGAEKKLQLHHMIMRYMKRYTDYWRYKAQRNYWANLLVLCKPCHRVVHGWTGVPSHPDDISGCLKVADIERIKKKYKIKEKPK